MSDFSRRMVLSLCWCFCWQHERMICSCLAWFAVLKYGRIWLQLGSTLGWTGQCNGQVSSITMYSTYVRLYYKYSLSTVSRVVLQYTVPYCSTCSRYAKMSPSWYLRIFWMMTYSTAVIRTVRTTTVTTMTASFFLLSVVSAKGSTHNIALERYRNNIHSI
jgi:hypothetical protein